MPRTLHGANSTAPLLRFRLTFQAVATDNVTNSSPSLATHTLSTLTPHGLEGAIIGKALYAQAFTLPDALAATR